MNLCSIFDQLDYQDRCHIIAILNTYSHEYTVLCRAHTVKKAMPLIPFFDRKVVLKCLKSWQHDNPNVDNAVCVRVTRMIDIMK